MEIRRDRVAGRAALFGAAALVAVLYLTSCARIGPKAEEQNRKLEDTKALVSAADSLPIEFRADLQLNAIESGNFPPSELFQNVLERLFDSAAELKSPYPFVTGNLTQNSFQRELVWGLQLTKLDTLEVRLRVIAPMSIISRHLAAQELDSIRLDIPRSTCSAALVPDVSVYYDNWADLSRRSGATDGSPGKNSFSRYEELIRRVTSVVQLTPLARLLVASDSFSPDQFMRLVSQYAVLLQQLQATDREVASMEDNHAFTMAMRSLAGRIKGRNLTLDPLLSSYRSFLIRSAGSPRCSDTTSNWKDIVEGYGETLHELRLAYPQLALSDLDAASGNGGMVQADLMQDPKGYGEAFGKIYALRQSQGSDDWAQQSVDRARGWESSVAEFFSKLDADDPSQAACPDCDYCERLEMLLGFFDFTPTSDYKKQLLDRFVQELATSPLQRDAPLPWLSHFKLLLDLARKPSQDQERQIDELRENNQVMLFLPSSLAADIRPAVKNSGNYAMYLYARAEELFENPYYSPFLK